MREIIKRNLLLRQLGKISTFQDLIKRNDGSCSTRIKNTSSDIFTVWHMKEGQISNAF